MNKLDFGSGYNPEKDFKTCDIYGNVDYYFDPESYRINTDDKFDYIRCRNVIHHIKDIDKLSQEFNRLLTDGGTLEIIDVRKEYTFIFDDVGSRGVYATASDWNNND